MTEDILEHLNRIAAMKSDLDRDKETMCRAATEIKRLRRERVDLLAALQMVINEDPYEDVMEAACDAVERAKRPLTER
jgi:hypothetical protein